VCLYVPETLSADSASFGLLQEIPSVRAASFHLTGDNTSVTTWVSAGGTFEPTRANEMA
jgi:hypothetical protein